MFHEQEGYSVASLCRLMSLAHSSYYYQMIERDESELQRDIEAVAAEFVKYGSRRVTKQLRRPPYKLVINRKRIRRIMREMGLLRVQKRRKSRTTDSNHGFQRYPNLVADLEVTYPDQVWVSDITYIRLQKGFVYLAVIMDVFTRGIRGWQLSRRLDQFLTLTALQRALSTHMPHIHHSDQGIQYAASDYIDLLRQHEVKISMSAKGSPEENAYAERLIRTIKEEEVELSEYLDFTDAYTQIGYFIEEVYQKKRIHSSLGYLTPMEFEQSYLQVEIEQMSSLKISYKVSNLMGPPPLSPSFIPCNETKSVE
jgi:putative transposase